MAALKLLWNNALIDRIENNSIKTEFQKLSLEFHKNPISRLQCYIAKSREDADHWRQLRHIGTTNGIGIVKWNAAAISRFSKQLGVTNYNSVALQIIDYLKEDTSFDDISKKKLDKVKITNLGRLVNDPDIREVIGLRVIDGELDISSLTKNVMTNLEILIDGISASNFNVKQIYQKPDRQQYIKSLGIVPVKPNGNTDTNGSISSGQQSQNAKNKARKL